MLKFQHPFITSDFKLLLFYVTQTNWTVTDCLTCVLSKFTSMATKKFYSNTFALVPTGLHSGTSESPEVTGHLSALSERTLLGGLMNRFRDWSQQSAVKASRFKMSPANQKILGENHQIANRWKR